MGQSRHRVRCTVGLVVATVTLAGCGGTQSAGSQPSSDPVQTASPSVQARAVTADVRACTGVQAVIGHLVVDTRDWSPSGEPFDKAVASHIRLRATELGGQAGQATTPAVRNAVHGVAAAFSGVAEAMGSRHRARVTRAVAASRIAYRRLKVACPG